MRALIMISGYRPRWPLPPVPDVNEVLGGIEDMPMLIHQIETLHHIGVTHIFLAVNSISEVLEQGLQHLRQRFGVTIVCKEEQTHYGTGGWLAVMRRDGLVGDDTIFLLQSDVICEYPLRRLLQFHNRHGREATMAVTKVDEPQFHDLVVMDIATSRVQDYAFYPHGIYFSDFVTARAYIFNPSVLDRAQLTYMTVEKDILPLLAEEHQLYAMEIERPFIRLDQIGFLPGLSLHVSNGNFPDPPQTAGLEDYNVVGRVRIHSGAEIHGPCHIGPDVVIGPHCKVETGAWLARCVLMRGATVKKGGVVDGSIICSGATVGEGAAVIDMSVVGESVEVARGVCLNGAVILGKNGYVRKHVINKISYAEVV